MDAETLWSEMEFASLAEVASKYGLSSTRVAQILDEAGYTGKLPNEPTAAEIAEAAAQIRRSWSPHERASRRVARRLSNDAV